MVGRMLARCSQKCLIWKFVSLFWQVFPIRCDSVATVKYHNSKDLHAELEWEIVAKKHFASLNVGMTTELTNIEYDHTAPSSKGRATQVPRT